MTRLLTAVLAMLALAGCGSGGGGHQLVGLTRDPEPHVEATALPDLSAGGQPFQLRAPKQGLLIVYFGYTNCPDVCPTTLSDLKIALQDLGPDAKRVETERKAEKAREKVQRHAAEAQSQQTPADSDQPQPPSNPQLHQRPSAHSIPPQRTVLGA